MTNATMGAATVADDDLTCPLCGYSLRALAQPRCPECGFAFDWAELRAADRARHPWLFEHGRGRRPATFGRTWVGNRWPWRFWRELSPTHQVSVPWLLVYWAAVSLGAAVLLLAPLPHGLWPAWRDRQEQLRASSVAVVFRLPIGYPATPPPLPVAAWTVDQCRQTWEAVRSPAVLNPDVIGPPLLVLAWPGLSAAALMLFRLSMRQAKIGPGHVLRVAIYGGDLGPAVLLAVVGFVRLAAPQRGYMTGDNGVDLAHLALFCGVVATVRLGVGYGRYLRFHRPLATVLASQAVVVVFAWTCLTLTTDLSDLFR